MRKSLTVIISAALLAVGAPVAGAAPGAAGTPPPTAPTKTNTAAETTQTFTLLTGDVVTRTVAADGAAYTFSVNASYVNTGPGGIKLQAWASHDDGATWTELSGGNGNFTVQTPKDATSTAIRVRAEDQDGNVVDQTVLDAWKVRAK